MKRHVAFLRGINVSGQKLIKMELLKSIFINHGYANVVTYIQSGNVVFDAKGKTDKIRGDVEKMLEQELGYKVVCIIRTVEELQKVADNNPYPELKEGEKLYITYLSALPDPEKLAALGRVLANGEKMQVIGREVYFVSPGYGTTKFSNTYIEKQLGLDATTRNLATTIKVTTL
jgi:uncharacterized protein (DUF1697 family)